MTIWVLEENFHLRNYSNGWNSDALGTPAIAIVGCKNFECTQQIRQIVQSFEYTEARKAYFTEQMICEILIALEQAAMSFDMEYDDRQKAMSTELSKAARKEWYLRHKDKGMEP